MPQAGITLGRWPGRWFGGGFALPIPPKGYLRNLQISSLDEVDRVDACLYRVTDLQWGTRRKGAPALGGAAETFVP